MRSIPSWDEYFLEIAKTIAIRSKDPSRQVGCVIIEPESKTIRSGGYNEMVSGHEESNTDWERPTKYQLVCHAEFNAVALAAKNGVSIKNCHVYCTCFPCLTCARLLIQAGISKISFPADSVATGYKDEKDYTSWLLMRVGIGVEPL